MAEGGAMDCPDHVDRARADGSMQSICASFKLKVLVDAAMVRGAPTKEPQRASPP